MAKQTMCCINVGVPKMLYTIRGREYTLPNYQQMTYSEYLNKTGTHLYNNSNEMVKNQQLNLVVVGIDKYNDYLLVEPHILHEGHYYFLCSDKTRAQYINDNKHVYITTNDTIIDLQEKRITDEITIWQWLDTTNHELLGNQIHYDSLYDYFSTTKHLRGITRKATVVGSHNYTVLRIAPMGDQEHTVTKYCKKPFTYYPDITHECTKWENGNAKHDKYIRIDMGESIGGDYSYIPLKCLYDSVYCIGVLDEADDNWHALETAYEYRKDAQKVLRKLTQR